MTGRAVSIHCRPNSPELKDQVDSFFQPLDFVPDSVLT
jgi:hypothetical protein